MSGAFTPDSARLKCSDGHGATTPEAVAFLTFCRVEKGLSSQTLSAYSADLYKFNSFQGESAATPGAEEVRRYIDHLYQTGLSNRTIARHITTLRNFYGFLLREGRIDCDPTEHLRTPHQWQTIPKFLNLEEIDKIVEAPDTSRPTGSRDRAMIELLFATGLRGS